MMDIYKLNTRDRPGLLIAMMKALASNSSRISFEGNLSQTELTLLDGLSEENDEVLKRATLRPKLDFIILSLTSESVAIIAKAFLSKISFTGYRGIIHAQIAKDGQLAFAAFDNFSQDTVWASVATIPAEFLDELTANGILNGYKRVN